MIYEIKKKVYTAAPVNFAETARYACAKTADERLIGLIESCARESEAENAVNYSVCYAVTPLNLNEDVADFSAFSLKSKNLVTALGGATAALVFACTLGVKFDRLIKKYSEINPSRALVFQALGAERVETFTDLFLAEYEKETGVTLTPRFSPGYGDLPLSAQRELFALLNPQKHLGLTLNDSLLMSPSKSVTAIAGVKKTCGTNETGETNGGERSCKNCTAINCGFRR